MYPLTIPTLDVQLHSALLQKINHKTKPLGALGRLEEIALQIGLIQNTLSPKLQQPVAFVFAGDHGVTEAGISPYPQIVTQQMVLNFLQGGAAINVFAKQMGFDLHVVDAGINADFDASQPLIHEKLAKGTQNFLDNPAMTEAQCVEAMRRGANLVKQMVAKGSNVFAFGEMGIGNTTSAAAIMHVLCKLPVSECAGRGAGLDDVGVQHKVAVIEQAIARHKGQLDSPESVLSHLGGFEIAMMVGAMLGAASTHAIVLVDGFICSAAALVATKMQAEFLSYCIFSHCSNESGHRKLLAHLQAQPVLDLGLRLGEGTGAVLSYPIIQAAVNFLNEMATFESANVSEKNA
jgi:nicotinate-nucleotide--dimethylbenzimidazole phosphoribosyltransferase